VDRISSWPLWVTALAFMAASAAIWWAGTRLERDADIIARRTGLGHAFTGMLLLAAATSLPELATTVTAVAILHNPTLAVHNLLGGVAMQTGILVIADATMRKPGALTYFSPRFVLLIQGVGLVLLMQVVVAGFAARGVPTLFDVSAWSLLLLVVYVGTMYFVYRYRGNPRWTPSRKDDVPMEEAGDGEASLHDGQEHRSMTAVCAMFAAMSLLVLAGGWLATETAEILAKQTGLGDAFLGATLLATATSLPELSTTIAATRNGRYTVAISNVFGSNAFDVLLLLLADVLYRNGSIVTKVETSAVFVATIGTVMTCIYLWGLMERENRTVWRMGLDSAASLLVYVGGMIVLYCIQ
jgi:cation:H+ antiporter